MLSKHIIFVQNVEYPKQWAVDIFYYSKYLSKYPNYKIKVIVSKINEDISNENLEIIELWKINYFSFIWKAFFKIKKINKESKISFVYFFAQHPFSVLLQFFVKYFLKIKTIYDVVSWPIGKWFVAFVSYITIRLGIFFSYKYILDHEKLYWLLNLKSKKHFEVIWVWYDGEVFKKNLDVNLLGKKRGELIFTYVWSLNIERKLDVFLRAFIKNIHKYYFIKLYFIWTWKWIDLLKSISWKYKDRSIFFLWKKEHCKIPDYINSSDILVSYVPITKYFQYQPPTKLIEYLACNKPCIATNTIAQKEILNWYDFLIHNDDFKSTKDKIEFFIKNHDKIKKLNFKNLVSDLSWKKLIDKKLVNVFGD